MNLLKVIKSVPRSERPFTFGLIGLMMVFMIASCTQPSDEATEALLPQPTDTPELITPCTVDSSITLSSSLEEGLPGALLQKNDLVF